MKSGLEVFGVRVVQEGIAEGGTSRIHRGEIDSPESPFGPPGGSLAIKEYKPSILDVPGQRQRIRQEASLTSKLKHPNVVRSWGLVPDEATGAELHILEWIDGLTLQAWNKRESDRSWD